MECISNHMQKSSVVNEKIIQYFNETLAMENAALDRIQTRIDSTLIQDAKQQLQYHYEQTLQQQDRLKTIITNLGGTPTETKAILPKLLPMPSDTITNTVKQVAKSITNSDDDKEMMDAEKELIQTKEDAIIENAEIVSYKMLMDMAEEVGLKDVVPMLKQSLQEETAMVNFIIGNAPLVLRLMLPKIEGARDKSKDNEKRRSLTSATS